MIRFKKDRNFLLKLYSVVVIIVFVGLIVHDAVAHVISFQRTGCNIEIFDVYGKVNATVKNTVKNVCYHKGLDVWTFRSLGKTDADVIVIVTHFFTSENVVGLGVSDSSDWFFVLTHPVSLFYLVKGRTDTGEEYLAVSPSILSISSGLNNKTIVLITCKLPGIEKFADAFLKAGARKVIVSNMRNLNEKSVDFFVEKVVSADSLDELCSSPLFTCYTG